MKVINIHQAKTHLSRLVEEAVGGETVVVAKAGKPLVQLVPVAAGGGQRPLGLLAGKVKESADCWSPDQEVEQWFYGREKAAAPRVAE
jgi:prevent-host-death family protein